VRLVCPCLLDCAVCACIQASSADVESSRSLTWAEAMKAGDTPVPDGTDDVYADTGAKADIHQLAAAVRKARAALSEYQKQWNELVQVGDKQSDAWLLQCWCRVAAAMLQQAMLVPGCCSQNLARPHLNRANLAVPNSIVWTTGARHT
jgi:hypothetical protein